MKPSHPEYMIAVRVPCGLRRPLQLYYTLTASQHAQTQGIHRDHAPPSTTTQPTDIYLEWYKA
jgi:hypothetical protein